MQLHLHQTHHTIGDFEKLAGDLMSDLEKAPDTPGLHLYPELYLSGYPLQDLCLQRPFVDRYLEMMEKLAGALEKMKKVDRYCALVGGLRYTFDDDQLPLSIENVIYKLQPGEQIEVIYIKQLLPNYDIFDELKYFSAGHESGVLEFAGKKIGLMICEDMWFSSAHPNDPTEELKARCVDQNIALDLVINLSASPFFLHKHQKRIQRAQEIASIFKAPFAYVNRVGGEDEILFDGASFVVDGAEVVAQAPLFQADSMSLLCPEYRGEGQFARGPTLNTWESLFKADIVAGPQHPLVRPWDEHDCAHALASLTFGIQEYAKKCGFQKFTVALSGGIDSALVLTIVKMSLTNGETLDAVYMPGLYSAGMSYDLSLELCRNLGVKMRTFPIKFLHSTTRNAFREVFGDELSGLADENIQSRLRGALIYTRSNQSGSMVLNTSNKSELAVGYSTQYGDSVGALSVLGDLYKSEVFRLAEYINHKNKDLIPRGIIERPPSAELRPDQKDSDSLPPYERLDAILEGLLSYRLGIRQLVRMGFEQSEVEKVYGLYKKSEYKRNQFGPIIKIKAKSFGFGYRVPITEKIVIK